MTNIFKKPEKRDRKKRLVEIGIETLKEQGWTVVKEKGRRKSSVYRITRNGESKLVSIKTTQDRTLAFAPKPNWKGWRTLDEVDDVIAVSVDGNEPPREALVHWLPAAEMRERFDRAVEARRKEGHRLPKGRGVWIPLYAREDASKPVSYVGGGAGLDYPEIARVPMNGGRPASPQQPSARELADVTHRRDNEVLTIAAAKRGLSFALGVPESSIRITIEA